LDIDDPANDSFKRELGYQVEPHLFQLDGDGTAPRSWRGTVSESDSGVLDVRTSVIARLGDSF